MKEGVPPDFRLHPTPDGGYAEANGPLYSRGEGEALRFGFLAGPEHTNAMGGVHGGRLMTFADQVLGLTVQDVLQTNRVATVSLNCDFVAGARPGQWIEGEAKITRMTRTLVFISGTIFHGKEVLLTAAGLWYRRPNLDENPRRGARES